MLVYVPSNCLEARLDLSVGIVCATIHNNDGFLDIMGNAAPENGAA